MIKVSLHNQITVVIKNYLLPDFQPGAFSKPSNMRLETQRGQKDFATTLRKENLNQQLPMIFMRDLKKLLTKTILEQI